MSTKETLDSMKYVKRIVYFICIKCIIIQGFRRIYISVSGNGWFKVCVILSIQPNRHVCVCVT